MDQLNDRYPGEEIEMLGIINMEKKPLLFMRRHCISYLSVLSFYHHIELEITRIDVGKGSFVANGKKYLFSPGDIFIFNNIEPHYIDYMSTDEKLVTTVLMFDPRFVWSIGESLFDSRYLDIFFRRNDKFENKLNSNHLATKQICGMLNDIEEEFHNRVQEYGLMVKVKLLNILAMLSRYYGYIRRDIGDSIKHQQGVQIINQIINYIDENLTKDIRLTDISELTHMNPSYLSTFFKKYMGMSVTDCITKKRIYKAVELLENSDKTVLEIALNCGYNNTANFNRAYKKITGTTPSYSRKHFGYN